MSSFNALKWWVLLLVVLTVAGFVPTYGMHFDTMPVYIHWHVVISSLWMLILVMQHHLISRPHLRGWHRKLGWASVLVFPVMIASGFWILIHTAEEAFARLPIFIKLYWVDCWLLLLAVVYYVLGLVLRKNRPIHMRLMLCTLLPLVFPGISRLLYFTVLKPIGYTFGEVFHYFYLLMLLLPLIVIFTAHDKRWPVPVAWIVIVLVYVSSFFITDAQWWIQLATSLKI